MVFGLKTFAQKQIEAKGEAYDYDTRQERERGIEEGKRRERARIKRAVASYRGLSDDEKRIVRNLIDG